MMLRSTSMAIFHLPARSILGPSLCPGKLTPARFTSWAPCLLTSSYVSPVGGTSRRWKGERKEQPGYFFPSPSGSNSFILHAWRPLVPAPTLRTLRMRTIPHCHQCLSALASLICSSDPSNVLVNKPLSRGEFRSSWYMAPGSNPGIENSEVAGAQTAFSYTYNLVIYYWKIIYEFGFTFSQEINVTQWQ